MHLLQRTGSILHSCLTALLSPSTCTWCKKSTDKREILCGVCTKRIRPIGTIPLQITKQIYIPIIAASDYQDPLKALVLAKRWSNRTASRQLGKLIWQHSTISQLNFDYLVPIPLHWTRYAARGYNQAEEIAYQLSKQSKKPIAQALKRNRKTLFQTTINRTARKENVKGAFSLNKKVPHDQRSNSRNNDSPYFQKTLVLVDDVMTTGSTLQAAARELLKLKPKAIIALVGCRRV